MMMKQTQVNTCYVGRLDHGADLLDSLTGLCVENNVMFGRVEAIGAVQRARIGFYNQSTRAYEFMAFDRPMEIANLIGNVSMKDGKPMVHAHITLGDRDGTAYAGHLAPGTIVFACEYMLLGLDGPAYERKFDEQTGLPLWQEPA